MVIYTTSDSKNDLEGILALQKRNLAASLTKDEILSQGFVTVDHSYDQLARLNDHEKHVIAKDKEKVIGYLLAMTKQFRFDIPVLIPMFDLFDTISYNDKKISEYNYLVVGQVCIDKAYRGQGVLDHCYAAYREHYITKYDFTITEIAGTNLRSLKAHKRIGFKEINTYLSPDKTEWVVVLWDWKNPGITTEIRRTRRNTEK
jgi:ribosomal protein S18 acetylase RimI-like enzyme